MRFFDDVVEVAAWTPGDTRGEGAVFLLHNRDDSWHLLDFAEPKANDLVSWLHALPEFDPAPLLGLITGRHRGIVPLWRTGHAASPRANREPHTPRPAPATRTGSFRDDTTS
jgi:hypothetical protein